MAYVVDTAIHDPFPFRDNAFALVSGKVNGDWTKIVLKDGATSAVVVTVSAVSGQSGYYDPSFTPNAVGKWRVFLTVTHSGTVYNFESDTYEVVTAAQADPAKAVRKFIGIR